MALDPPFKKRATFFKFFFLLNIFPLREVLCIRLSSYPMTFETSLILVNKRIISTNMSFK